MALITCPECGREVSDQADKCPNCGYPLKKQQWVEMIRSIDRTKLIAIVAVLLVAVAALIVVLGVLPAQRRARIARTAPFREVGNVVTFGQYPKTEAGADRTPIEWIVLDVVGNKALMLSRYGLDTKSYNTEFVDITWETCDLRTWLNGDFVNTAFSKDEQKAILTTTVDNSESQGYIRWDTDGGNNTQDKIFLLSYAEANKYLDAEYSSAIYGADNMRSLVAPTAYAVKNGAYRTRSDIATTDGKARGWWWLRSPGDYQKQAAYITIDGYVTSENIHAHGACVRPAMWVDLDSGIF